VKGRVRDTERDWLAVEAAEEKRNRKGERMCQAECNRLTDEGVQQAGRGGESKSITLMSERSLFVPRRTIGTATCPLLALAPSDRRVIRMKC